MFFDMETTGLDPSSDQIVTIQVRRRGRNYIWKAWKPDEYTAIDGFLDFLTTLRRHSNPDGRVWRRGRPFLPALEGR